MNSKTIIGYSVFMTLAVIITFAAMSKEISVLNQRLGEKEMIISESVLKINEANEIIDQLRIDYADLSQTLERMTSENETLKERTKKYEDRIQELVQKAAKIEKEKKRRAVEASVSRGQQAPQEGKELKVEATAYTAYCTGCSGTTYTGDDLRANPDMKVIAVDPNVIPLRTKVWVEGYGYAMTSDIGSAIKGHKIDVFIPDQADALRWGRRHNVTVKILD